jgi:hypothetical protein
MIAVMGAIAAGAAHVDEATGSPAISAEATVEMTVAEASTSKAAAAETHTTRVPNARMTAARVPAETAGMPPTEAAPAEVTTTTEVAAEGRRVGRRERADRNRDGGSSEHRLECPTDHRTLQYRSEQSICFGNWRLNDLCEY